MARDQPEGNRIGDIRSNDWDGDCRLFHRDRQLSIADDHNIRLETNYFVRERRPARQIAIGISICNVDVATRDIAEFLHAPYKRSYDRCRRRLPIYQSDERALSRDLGDDAEWPSRRSAEQRDELSPPHGKPPRPVEQVETTTGSLRCASQQDRTPDFRSGSIATNEVGITRSRMSASPLKADNLHTISASPLSAS